MSLFNPAAIYEWLAQSFAYKKAQYQLCHDKTARYSGHAGATTTQQETQKQKTIHALFQVRLADVEPPRKRGNGPGRFEVKVGGIGGSMKRES